MDSILDTIKKLLGIDPSYTAFDTDIIVGINAAINVMTQLGIGTDVGFVVTSSTDKWSDFLPANVPLEMAKQYVYLKTKLIFDPPSSSFATESIKNTISEYEWRMNVQVDKGVE